MANNSKRTFSQFRAEAKVEPYVIEDSQGSDIVIEAPNTDQLFRLAEGGGSPRNTLEIICGDSFEAVYAEVKHLPIEAFNEFFEDLMGHFNMGGSVPPHSGGN